MSDVDFDDVLDLALQLSRNEQAQLVARLAFAIAAPSSDSDDEDTLPPWTDEEIAEMTQIHPRTGADIVAAELLGG